MYERTREYLSFHIAGFSHWYGATELAKLAPGRKLEMKHEPDNPYDPNAVALFFEGTKLGYVPRRLNYELSQLMFFGHEDIFEAIVVQVDPRENPEEQVRASIFVKDRRR